MTTITLKTTFASLPKTTRGQFIIINGDPKGKNFLYCNGSQVYIRNIEEPSICDVYSEHSKDTTVAKYSPSGFYIASADISGKVRVWDTVQKEHILKIEHNVIGGPIKDLDWSSDNTKLVAAGEGRQQFARVITWDSGNTVGEIIGHSKTINGASFKPTRPFRLVTAGEDFQLTFFEGPPFKFKHTKREASNFVNCVRYSPEGEIFIAGGAEGKLWIYDGKTSDFIAELGEPKAHKGGIYAISFSADSKKLLSVSGDKTAKIWDIATRSMETEFVMGTDVMDMQVGCLWQGDHLITVSLSGWINYLDPGNPSQPKKIIKGHNKPITALEIKKDESKIYSASYDGMVVEWNGNTGDNETFKGKGHTNQIVEMKLDGDNLVTVGWDDTIRFHNAASQTFGEMVKLESQPRALDAKNGIAVVVCIGKLVVFNTSGKQLSSLAIDYDGASCSIHPNGTQVAVGSADKKGFYLYELSNGTLSNPTKKPAHGAVTAIAYSPDGSHLGVSNVDKVFIYDLSSWEDLCGNWSAQHASKVTSLAWSPDSRRLASGSIDSHIILWEAGKIMGKKPTVKAHLLSHINKLSWLNSNTIVTAGQDANLKLWDVSE